MKRYIYYIWCLLGLGLLTGCMFEEESIETEDDNLVHMVFTAMVEDGNPATRTVLDENEADGFRGVLWEPEDVIGIATYNGRYQRFENVLEEPAASGVFEGSVNQDIMYYAIYPYRDNQQMSTSVNVTIPSKQTYKPNSFDGSAAPMVGKGNHAEPLHFMNLCGALAVQLTGNEKVRSIIFQANANDKVSGDGTVDPDYGDYPVLQMGDVADNFIILDCGEGVQLSGTPTSFHFVLPPGTYNGFKLIISTTDGQFMEKSTDKQLKIKRSIVTKAASFAFENNVRDFINLSEKGHSNCYIVPGSGFYCFDVNVIGNGEFGLIYNAGFHTDETNIDPMSVDILWEDTESLIRGYGYDAQNKRLCFIAGESRGNALFVAKDNAGNILWSWHIWLTDQPVEQTYINSMGTYVMLDRNIGAIRADRGVSEEWKESQGVLYQWGRKDPIVRGCYTLHDTRWESFSILQSIQNPTVLPNAGANNAEWMSPENGLLWSPIYKTIYDPCPNGYKVPVIDVWKGFLKDDGTLNTSGEYDSGWYFVVNDLDVNNLSWYPANDYIPFYGEYKYRSDAADYWHAASRYSFNINQNTVNYDWFDTSSATSLSALHVRCMKDEGYVDISYPQVSITGFDEITTSSVTLKANVKSEGISSVTERGFIYGLMPDLSDGTKVQCGNGGGDFSYTLSGLASATMYYVKAYAINSRGETQTPIRSFSTKYSGGAIDLSLTETANSYIVKSSGAYVFDGSVKGNSFESVGVVSSVEVLWESYGTSETPSIGSLISTVSLEGTAIVFEVPEPFMKGNAVIAVKDASGTILWSWHIWFTDQPEEQIYPNNAGTMMDRNLGATSATPGDLGCSGLFYQWGRKDPFLGAASVNGGMVQSTIVWPTPIPSNSTSGTIDYIVQHPTTYVYGYDWLYSQSDNSLWNSVKTLYDPCPPGWRVPDGGDGGVWSIAGFPSGGSAISYDHANRGASFNIASPSSTWYPTAGYFVDGALSYLTIDGRYWSATAGDSNYSYNLGFNHGGDVAVINEHPRGYGFSVRCLKEGTGGGPQYNNDFSISGARDLSDAGTANSYIVSSAGTYGIPAVKGNSSESVGSVAYAEVLWESYGTDESIHKGSLVSGARYEKGQIYFKTADSYREGNAVIAAKDLSDNILWSWHIWLTDEPQEQVYPNDACVMLDRDLGATSATPGDVGVLGLLYQWGRKDPFLSGSSIDARSNVANSTIVWPLDILIDGSSGNIEYATKHPTTFMMPNENNWDWYYTSNSNVDDTRWHSIKTIYDPCPAGWKVPEGGGNGVWNKADFAKSSSGNSGWYITLSISESAFYPSSGYRDIDGRLYEVGVQGKWWSSTVINYRMMSCMTGYGNNSLSPLSTYEPYHAIAIRCAKE